MAKISESGVSHTPGEEPEGWIDEATTLGPEVTESESAEVDADVADADASESMEDTEIAADDDSDHINGDGSDAAGGDSATAAVDAESEPIQAGRPVLIKPVDAAG